MKDSKLVRLLKTFSPEEWKEFEKFAASPYFNKGRNYIPLLKVLKKFHPSFESDKMTAEYVYGKLYGSKKFNQDVINTNMSGLYSVGTEFITYLSYNRSEFRKDMDLAYELDRRNIDDIHNAHFKKVTGKLLADKFSGNFLEQISVVQQHKIDFSYKSDYEKTVGENYEKVGDYLYLNFIIKIIGHYRNLITLDDTLNYKSNKALFKTLIDHFNFEDIIEHTKKFHSSLTEVVDAVLATIYSSINDEAELFLEAKRKIFTVHRQIENMYMKDMLVHLEMAAVLRYENGNRDFIYQRHMIHRFWIENNYHIYSNGIMQTRVIENSALVAAWVKEKAWLQHFLETQSCHFAPELREIYTNYCKTFIMFLDCNYKEAIKLIKKVPFEFTTLKLKVKVTELMINYKMQDYETAILNIDSLKHFLANNRKVSDYMRKSYTDFLRIYEKLILYKNSKDIEIGVLLMESSESKPSFMIDWLIDELTSILNNKGGA